MSKTLAVVVSYHPEAGLVANVNALLLQVDHIVIVDNESSADSQNIIAKCDPSRVTGLLNPANNGVAKGFNQGIQWGMDHGYDYVLLMDQDSLPQAGMFENLLQTSQALGGRGKLVLVGPHHEDFDRKIPPASSEKFHEVPLLITSGSLLSRKMVEQIGAYDEKLFIDHVDHDYCLRLQKKGGICVQVNTAILLHKFGEAKVKTVLGKSFFMQDYSAFRRYHMMRNRIVLYKRYGILKGAWFWMDLRSAVKDLIKLVLFESGKAPKLRAVFSGLADGLRWKD